MKPILKQFGNAVLANYPEEGGRSRNNWAGYLLSLWQRIEVSAMHRGRRLHSLANAIWCEIRSLVPRIQLLKYRQLDQVLLLGKAFEYGPNRLPVPNNRTSARIADISLLEERYPWATAVDCLIFLEGWSRGSQYEKSLSNSDSRT
jgi:hypothetical protein